MTVLPAELESQRRRLHRSHPSIVEAPVLNSNWGGRWSKGRRVLATALAAVALACGNDSVGPEPGSGTVSIVTTLEGNGRDPNGVIVGVDGAEATVFIGDSVKMSNVAAGSRRVSVSDLSRLCRLLGTPERHVEVEAGQTTTVEFRIACFGNIAFISTRDHPRDVHFMDELGDESNLTNDPEDDILRDMSPDGTQVVFTRGPLSLPDIYVVNVDGSGLTNLTNSPSVVEGDPRWSPDGSLIMFGSNRDSDGDIFTIRPDGTELTNVTKTTTGDGRADWSPDGSQIVFVSNVGPGNREIFVMNADGSDRVNVSNHPATDTRPVWSPRGDLIAFESMRNGLEEPWVVAPDGSGLRRLYAGTGISYVWSPDGTRLLFTAVTNFDLMLVNADGTGLFNLTNHPANDGGGATWLPDGSWIVFSSVRNGQHLYAVHPDGSQLLQITTGTAIEFRPRVRGR